MRDRIFLVLIGSGLMAVLGSSCSPNLDVPSVPDAPFAVPALSAVMPELGPTEGGIELTLFGRDFEAGTLVTVDGVAATRVAVDSASLLTATLPARPGKWGPASVAVINPDGQTASRGDLFAYYSNQVDFVSSAVTAGRTPFGLATGDFNGDLKVDLAVANYASDSLSVFLGNGIGGFGPATNLFMGANSSPRSVTVGDFNADLNPDLAVANSNSNEVSVLLGDGNGSFIAGPRIPVGSNPIALAVGDFNFDERLDLVVVSAGNNNLSVLLGDGVGGFLVAGHFAVGMHPLSVAVADFNDDQRPDLAVVNHMGDSVSVLLCDGYGDFGTAAEIAVGRRPFSLAVKDLNGDKKLDLAVVTEEDHGVSILLGDGMGGFGLPANFTVGKFPYSIAVGDFNGDQRPDLVIANATGSVSLLSGNGRGGFGAPADFVVDGSPLSLVVADFNGDKKPDLAVSDGQATDNAHVSILINQAQ